MGEMMKHHTFLSLKSIISTAVFKTLKQLFPVLVNFIISLGNL